MRLLDEAVAAEIYASAERLGRSGAKPLEGSSSSNWLVSHPATGPVLVRRPLGANRARRVRAANEAGLLSALAPRLEFVPRLLHVADNLDQIHEAKPGVKVTLLGAPPPDSLPPIMTDHLARLSNFPLAGLPARLRRRLGSPDARVFARELVDEAATAWDRTEAAAPGVTDVYTRLGAGPRGLVEIRLAVDRFRLRELVVVHTDLHTGNVLATTPDNATRHVRDAAVIDWERGRIGDPLFDFVRHTVASDYSEDQVNSAVLDYVDKTRPDIRAGIAEDWSAYEHINLARRRAYGTERAARELRRLRKAVERKDAEAEADLHLLARKETDRLNTEQRDHHRPPIVSLEAVEREFLRYVTSGLRRPRADGPTPHASLGLTPIAQTTTHRSSPLQDAAQSASPGAPTRKGTREQVQGRKDGSLGRALHVTIRQS